MVVSSIRLTSIVSRSILLLGTILLYGCKDRHAPLPNLQPVNLELSLYVHKELLTPGGMLTLTEPRTYADRLGYAGLLIVRSLTEEQFYAYDLACSYEFNPTRLELHNGQAVCPKCQSEFDILLSHGAPTYGPAQRPLRTYRTHYSVGSRLLRITN